MVLDNEKEEDRMRINMRNERVNGKKRKMKQKWKKRLIKE